LHELGYPRGPAAADPHPPKNFLPMQHSRHFDHIAIALSAICIVHCLAVPVLVAVLPIIAVSFGESQHFHGLMLWLVVPTSFAGLSLGYRLHRRSGLIALGAVGVALLVLAAVYGHETWYPPIEVLVSVAGSLLLGGSHWLNFRAVRRCHRH
jgi:hypothetical protein